jgi:hypothetical protein
MSDTLPVDQKAKPTREEALSAKLAKLEEQQKKIADQLKKERLKGRSKAQGEARKRRSRALILIGASCELAMKADEGNIEKVKVLIMKHLTKQADQELVTEYLKGVSIKEAE